MITKRSVLIACLTGAAAFTACYSPPTDVDVHLPYAIVTSSDLIQMRMATNPWISAYVVDRTQTRIAGPVTAMSAGGAVSIDSVKYIPELKETHIFLNVVAMYPANATKLTLKGQGLTKDVSVVL